ncbi:MAG TPA: c-type cytochrome [Terracidiphilus sp.]
MSEAAKVHSTPHPANLEEHEDMNQSSKLAFGTMCALLCGLCISIGALGETLPDGKGKTEFVHNCTACHRADMVTRVKKTPDEWRKSVDEMAARGTDGTKEDLDSVVLYLDTNFAKDTSSPAAATPSATPSSTSGGPAGMDSSETERVKRLITDNGCLVCHRIEQQGAYSGPALNGIGARRTPDEIRAAIVTPAPTLDASNNLVRLTTADGKTLVGRILSQDDQDVRVIDASGEVATYSKPGLRQFTIIDANPMPSYERKITGDDLDNLVRYLASLPSIDQDLKK